MVVRLDKWYLDCRTPEGFGYYYVMRLRAGPVGLAATEVHHGDRHQRRTRLWVGAERTPASRRLQAAGATLTARRRRIDLSIPAGGGDVRGTWSSRSAPPRRPEGLLFRNRYGWCDWKVWTPRADVALDLGGRSLRGRGYADYVRLTFQPWRLPIRSIHWGHLAAGDRALVLFQMHIGGRRLAWVHGEDGWNGRVEVRTRADAGHVRAFEWRLGDRRVTAESVRVLERGPILGAERLGRALPHSWREALASRGYEEKHWVEADVEGVRYEGPMEEVRFDVR